MFFSVGPVELFKDSVGFSMPFCKPLNGWILTVILTFLTAFGTAGKLSGGNALFADEAGFGLGTLTNKVEGGTSGTNGGSIGEGRTLTGDVDLDVDERLDAFELILSVDDLTA